MYITSVMQIPNNKQKIAYYATAPIYTDKRLISTKKTSVSFGANLSRCELVNNGYTIANIDNNKISNTENKIIITSADKLVALTKSPSVWSKKFVLASNIDLKGAEISPIGNANKPFTGVFNGNGYKISNFKIVDKDNRNIGLFGKCEKAEITDLFVDKVYIKGKQQVGGISGYASNTNISNCDFSGYIEGEKKIGGLVGLGFNNEIKNCSTRGSVKIINPNTQNNIFDDGNRNFYNYGIAGGFIGSDAGSKINNSFSESIIYSENQAGGLIGYSEKSDIESSCFKGSVIGNTKIGSLIGWGTNSKIEYSYSLCNLKDLIGENSKCKIGSSFYDWESFENTSMKDWKNWYRKGGSLPRLEKQVKMTSAKDLFLEDINTDISTGKIANGFKFESKINEKIKINLKQPKHYDCNNAILDKIKKSSNTYELRKIFADTVMKVKSENILGKNSSDKYDEILLALVKNQHMDVSSTFECYKDDLNDGRYYNVWCNPLYILTCMNKAYILQEALKRNDADYKVGSGYAHNETLLYRALNDNIDDCTYVLFTMLNMRDYIDENMADIKTKELSPFAKLLVECYPDIPPYDEKEGCIEFTKEFEAPKELLEKNHTVKSIEDVIKNGWINPDYKDSFGNNIVNIASTVQNEEEALKIFFIAKECGVPIDNFNSKYETPIGHAIYTQKPHLTAQLLLNNTQIPYLRISDGTDAALLFSNMKEQNYSVNYLNIAKQKGFSINTCDNEGNTPLINQIKNKNYEGIKFLINNGANVNQTDNAMQTPLHHACLNQDVKSIKMLLDSYASPYCIDKLGCTPFEYLNEEDYNEIKSQLNDQKYLYEISGLDGNLEEHKYYNFDNKDKIYELNDFNYQMYNSDNPDIEIQKLNRNIKLNSDILRMRDFCGNTALHIAASSSSPYAKECIKTALDNDFDINSTNNDSKTPLMCALDSYLCALSIEDKISLFQNIKLLLDNNPNIDMVDNNKQSAFHRVCQSGNIILFNETLKLNPKLNQHDLMDNTPFEYIPMESDAPMRLIAEEYLKNNKIVKGDKR